MEASEAAGPSPAGPVAVPPSTVPHLPLEIISEDGVEPARHVPAGASHTQTPTPRMLGVHVPQGPDHQGPVSVAAAGRAGSAPGRIQETGHADILQGLFPDRSAPIGASATWAPGFLASPPPTHTTLVCKSLCKHLHARHIWRHRLRLLLRQHIMVLRKNTAWQSAKHSVLIFVVVSHVKRFLMDMQPPWTPVPLVWKASKTLNLHGDRGFCFGLCQPLQRICH